MTMRRALVLSPFLCAAAAAALPACGARSLLNDAEVAAAGGAGGTGGGTSSSSSSSSTTTSSSSSTTTSSSSSTTTSSSSSTTTSSSSSTTSSSSSTSSGTTMNPVISESPNQFLQAETSVTASQNGVVSVAWIDVDNQGKSTIGYTFSTDDGGSFGAPQQIVSPGNRVASDPVLAIDGSGNIYVSWVAYLLGGMGGQPSSMRIYVAVAPAGSTTFGQPIRVSPPNDGGALYDKPWITVTNTGTVVVTYQRDAQPNDYSLVAARSTDGGMTWQRTNVADDPTGSVFRNLAFPCAPKNGNHLWVTFLALDGTGVDVKLARSDDGGATWLPETLVSLANENVAFDDPNCVADGEQVWVTYGLSLDPMDQMAATSQKLNSVQLAYSTDAGQTVASRGEAADLGAAKFFMHPQIAREDGGAIDVVYYVGDLDQDGNGSFRRARAPFLGGFSPALPVEAPVTFLQARSDQRWLGDYTGIFWRGGQAYTSYVVNTSGTSHVAFAKYATP